jgi:pimeloyl-ACP methyl ester carboxylesterase
VSHAGRRPVVLVPGIQGRREWMRPAMAALATTWDVHTFSLQEAPDADGFDGWHDRISDLIDTTGATRVPVAGVSFGGVIAATYAARHPDRVSHLVLVSAPPPRFDLDPETARYVRHPRLALPAFAWRGVRRLWPEVVAAHPGWQGRAAAAVAHGWRTIRWPASPGRMAAWVRTWQQADLTDLCRRIEAPTLLVTGEPGLDRVVPVPRSREWLDLVPDARHVVLPRTGHIGLVLRPDAFAAIVTGFLEGTPDRRGGPGKD